MENIGITEYMGGGGLFGWFFVVFLFGFGFFLLFNYRIINPRNFGHSVV